MSFSSKSSSFGWLVSLVLVGLVFVAFGKAAWFEATSYDDPEWLTQNPAVQAGLNGSSAGYAFSTPILGHWAPLTVLSHMAVCQAQGLAPKAEVPAGAHHVVNVALHALGAVLLFVALRSLTQAPWRSAIAAALFAVHPMRTESVVWITERKDVLSGVFFALTLRAYVGWTRRRTTVRYLLIALSLACGLMAKSMLVTLPFVLLLLDYWPLRRASNWRDWLWHVVEKLPLFALSAASAFWQYRLVERELMPVAALDWSARLGNAAVSYGIYLRQLFWTGPLAVFYPHAGSPGSGSVWAAAVVLLGVTAILFFRRKAAPFGWVGWLWFLGMLVPVIGLVQSGEIARADRYTYLPHVGLIIVVVWGVAELAQRGCWPVLVPAVATALALAAAVFSSRAQAEFWRTDETLWRHALAVTENNHHAHTTLGVIETRRGHHAEAAAHFREAVQLSSMNWRAYGGLAQVLLLQGDPGGAMEAAERAHQLVPSEPKVHALLADATVAQAAARDKAGALSEAAALYQRVLGDDPHHVGALDGLAQVLMRTGQVDQAQALAERALAQQPKDGAALYALGTIRAMRQQYPEAVKLYRQALAAQPDMAEAQANLAWILSTSTDDSLRNGPEAVRWAESACTGPGAQNPAMLRILAAAHAEAGQFPEAVATIERALALAQPMGDPHLTARLQMQRELYQTGQPLRVPMR